MRVRRLLLVLAALVVAGALVAPIVITQQEGSGPSNARSCATTLLYKQRVYKRRSPGNASVTQSTATGVGVLSGCGQKPTNVSVRSLIGIRQARAVAIDGDPDLYVRPNVCAAQTGTRLARCLMD